MFQVLLQGFLGENLILQGFGLTPVIPSASSLNLAIEDAFGDDATAASGSG